MIGQDQSAQKICGQMTTPAKTLTDAQKEILAKAKEKFQKIVQGSNNLVFVTSAVNREKANYHKLAGTSGTYDPQDCTRDKTENVKACAVYMGGILTQAKGVASELAKLFQDASKKAYGAEVTLDWASKIETGINSAIEL